METLKQFGETILDKIRVAEDEGNTFVINEIAANIMTGTMMLIISGLTILCLILNEVGVFSADLTAMRRAAMFSILIGIPGMTLNRIYHGEKKWLKYFLCISLLLQIAALSCILGHNVALAMAIPAVISVRYFDEKFTAIISGATSFEILITSMANADIGILNLNVVPLAPGTTLNIVDTLRNAVTAAGFDKKTYVLSVLLNDFFPRFLIFTVIAMACARIARRSKQYIELQDRVAKKSSRIETELDLANRIQSGMLPNLYPAFPEYDELDIFALNRPAKEVGGDFYDFFKVDEGRIAFLIADVSGKGVGAALFSMISKALLKNHIQSADSIAQAVTKANNQLCENNTAEMFVTMWAGLYEVKTGKLTYVNAGHNPPLLYNKTRGEYRFLKEKHGLVLGAMPDIRYRSCEMTLQPDDMLLLYTDGVTEATDAKNAMYGEERLMDFLKTSGAIGVRNTLNSLIDDVDSFVGEGEQFDDITALEVEIIKHG